MPRRTLGCFIVTAMLTSAAMSGQTPASPAAKADLCAGARDLRLVNGKIVTMDRQNSVVNEVTIQDGLFATVGPLGTASLSPCTKEIDLGGRTAVPGLIDNHNHIILLGLRPGYDTRLETAASITDVQTAIRARASGVPSGAFLTAMGGWHPAQFVERRLPSLAELDVAAPEHPVLVYQGFTGPAATNTRGRAFFVKQGIEVSETGAIAANAPSLAALNTLRAAQTFEDRKRGMLDAMAYAASVGLTTNVDMGAFILPGTPNVHDSFAADTLASADPFGMYDPLLALHGQGKMSTRIRVFFLTMDTRPDVPMLTQRLRDAVSGFGDDMLRPSGIGEFATSWPLFGQPPPANYVAALQLIANQAAAFQQHSLSAAENELTASAFETVNKTTPIADLRWTIAHVPAIDLPMLNRFKAMGVGVAVHPFQYLADGRSGPPLRTIVDSGIHVGAGSDAAQISTLNPWLIIYYMVTGKNSGGTLINAGQQLTRMEALRLYTVENGWFLREEDTLGSIETGKLADLVVLSDDFFDAAKVPDEAIKRVKSVLTVVDGTVVHDETQGLKTRPAVR